MIHRAEFKPRKNNWGVGTKLVEDDLVHDDKIYRGTDQVGKLCRDLEYGYLAIYRNGKLAATVDVEKRMEKTLVENDKQLGYKKYRPFLVYGNLNNVGCNDKEVPHD